MDLTNTSLESAMTAKHTADMLLCASSPMSDRNESNKDILQTALATASDDFMLNSAISAHVTPAEHPGAGAAIPTESKAATPTLMGLPRELRQRILCLVLSTVQPMSPENGSYIASLPSSRSIRIETVRRFTPTRREASKIDNDELPKPRGRYFTRQEAAVYVGLQPLYIINRTIHVEMRFVEQDWLEQRGAAAPLSLGAFVTWAAAPTLVNGILTLSLFDKAFIARPPPLWEGVVRSIAADRHTQLSNLISRPRSLTCWFWRSEEYLRTWREATKLLAPLEGDDKEMTVARRYGIEAVEVVDVIRCVLTPQNDLEERMGMVHQTDLARLAILLMRRFGLQQGRVRITGLV